MPEVFLDTNVLAYVFDHSEPFKRQQAKKVLSAHPAGAISTQVLLEWFTVVTRKLIPPLDQAEALQALEVLAMMNVVPADAELVVRAARTSVEEQLSLWDAMIVEAAVLAGCDTVLTEDLADGRLVRGVRIENPFG